MRSCIPRLWQCALQRMKVVTDRISASTSSHFITFHHISSHFITFHHISSHFITFHHISSHFITFHHISSHFITFHHISSVPFCYLGSHPTNFDLGCFRNVFLAFFCRESSWVLALAIFSFFLGCCAHL